MLFFPQAALHIKRLRGTRTRDRTTADRFALFARNRVNDGHSHKRARTATTIRVFRVCLYHTRD